MKSAAWALGLLVLGACAPASVSPMILRMDRGNAHSPESQIGLRTGARASSSMVPFGPSNAFQGDRNSFEPSQWGIAYDAAFTQALTDDLRLHVGGVAEFSYPFPLPGYGVYLGLSHWLEAGPLRVVPSIAVRGATDFGISVVGGPGSFVGVETSATLSVRAHPRLALGFIPFVGVQRTWAGGAFTASTPQVANGLFYGGVLAVQLELDAMSPVIELSGGSGRMMVQGKESFNTPLMGVRVNSSRAAP